MQIRIFAVIATLMAAPALADINIKNIEAEGNLAPTQNAGCIAMTSAAADLSPADLSLSIMACYRKGQDKRAAKLLALLYARGRFDAARVTDKTAHQAIEVLVINLTNEGGPDWQGRMNTAFTPMTETGSSAHRALCRDLAKLQAPQHSPRYMIQHGIKAITGKGPNPLVANFDAEETWSWVVNSYMRCADSGS
ncbi:hypothetical protein [Thalassovita mangrovi]|uniref:Uncharacterized protein n=1 Tax=Thalassovita mangrovi TaxID=2692236 RepID=A0A6L8LVY4_9RHOB|nr:hypothetical protein [Thalassovita mangrovi]MYM57472.1 hypothetical protein [Thalassovita mangrovi]